MSSLQDQIDARKRRLAELRSKRNNAASSSDKHDEREHKKSKTRPVRRDFDIMKQEVAAQSTDKLRSLTVETSSTQFKKQAGDEAERSDEIVTGSERPSSTKAKHNWGIDAMRAKVEKDLRVLDRRTNEEIRRIVRREFMQDALTKNG